jgi:hypothetical protein
MAAGRVERPGGVVGEVGGGEPEVDHVEALLDDAAR